MRRNDFLADFERSNMQHPPMSLSSAQRASIARTITETAGYKGLRLLAANVRTNHVHIVISGNATPERIMSTLKSWCTRRLRESGLVEAERPIWSRHGGTDYLWTDESVERAIWYVNEMQDEPRAR